MRLHPLLLALLCFQAMVPTLRAECPATSSLDLQAELSPGNQLLLQWNAAWPQSRWRVEQSDDPRFLNPTILGETSQTQWPIALAGPGLQLFRVVPVDTLAAADSLLVEDFEGQLPFFSWPGEDLDPAGWSLDPDGGSGSTSLHLFGNTVKGLPLARPLLSENSRFRIRAYSGSVSDRQMVGFADSSNVLWYVLWGTRGGYPDSPGQSGQTESTAYQGFFETGSWHTVVLEAGRDFLGKYGYLPRLCSVVFANESDEDSGEVWFDQLEEVSGLEARRPSAQVQWIMTDQTADSTELLLVNPLAAEGLLHVWNPGDGRRIVGGSSVALFVSRHRDHRITVYVEDPTGAWQTASALVPAAGTAQPRGLRMGFVGDIMTGRGYEAEDGIINTQGVDAIFAGVAPSFQAMDLMMGNLECSYTTADTPHPTKGIVFRTRPENVSGLLNAGLDYVTLANNHTYDYQLDGMTETMQVLDAAGLPHNGSGLNSDRALRPAMLSADGLAVGVVAMCDRTGNYNNYQPFLDAGPSRPGFALWSRGNMQAAITALRPQVDWLVLQVHSGNEYSQEPSRNTGPGQAWQEDFPWDPELRGLSARELNPDQSERSLRQEAIELGANLVITHHPHILQGLEVYQGGLIAHSLGNFVMDLSYLETMTTALLDVQVAEDELQSVRVHPAFIQDWIPGYLRGGAARMALDQLSSLSRDFDTWLIREPGDSTARVILDTTAVIRSGELLPLSLPLADVDGWYESAPWFHEGSQYLGALGLEAGEPALEYRVGRELCWWGNMEDEGISVWDLNSDGETWDSSQAHSGERSIRLVQEGNGTLYTYFTTRGPLDPQKAYTLGGWVRTQNASTADLQMRYYDSRTGNLTQSEVVYTTSGTQDWSWGWQDLAPDAARRFWQLRLRVSASTGTATGWFDDVHLVEWSEWRSLDAGDSQELRFPDDGRAIQVRRSSPGSATLQLRVDTVDLPVDASLTRGARTW